MIRDHFPRRKQKVPWSTLLLMIILFLMLLWIKFDYHRRGSFYRFFTGAGETGRRAAYLPPDSLRQQLRPAAAESLGAGDSVRLAAPGKSGARNEAGAKTGTDKNAKKAGSRISGSLVQNPDGTWSFVPPAGSAGKETAGPLESGRHGALIQNPDGTWSFVPDTDTATSPAPGAAGAVKPGTLVRNPDGSWTFVPDAGPALPQANGGPDSGRLGAGDSIAATDSAAAVPNLVVSRKVKPPVVEAYPGGGLFARKVEVKLQSGQACTVYYSFNDSLHPQVYREPFRITRDTLLYFWGVDSAGNRSAAKKRWYDIADSVSNPCPQNMVLVYREDTKFCIDRFEWPNQEGKKPQGFFSFYQARDSCRLAGKYLCPAAQWQAACNSFNRFQYPYGNEYEPTTCNTAGAAITASGSLPGCRTYFGIFDMCGNLREWVDSPAPQNRRFFQVRGGSWESYHNSACNGFQYSYYPENRYTSIGFRCCQAAP